MAEWLDGYYENKKLLETTLNIDPGGGPTPPDDSVTNAILSPMDANTVKVNATALSENPTDLPMATSTVLGRGPTGNIDDLTIGAGLVISDTALGRAALTGDVTAAANSNTTAIAANVVTNAQLAQAGANSIKSNSTASTANVSDLTINASRVTGRGPTGNLTGLTVGAGLTISDTNIGRAALTGDVTASADSNATTISALAVQGSMVANNTIGNGKLSTMATATVKGNSTGSTGNVQDCTLTGGLSMVSGSPGSLKSKGSVAYSYIWSSDTSEADPGTAGIKFNNATLGSVTEIYIDPVASGSRNIAKLIEASGQLAFMSNNESGTARGLFTITSIVNNAGNFYSVAGTMLTGFGAIPTDGEEILIVLQPAVSGGLTTQDVLDMKVVRTDVNGFLIDNLGNIISGPPTVADYTALLALNAADYDGFAVNVQSGLNNSFWASNGTAFTPLNGEYIQERSATPGDWFIGGNNVTYTAADNGSGKVRLTASAAHGLTTTPAVGSKLYQTGSATGWTANTGHQIATIVDTTHIDLTTNYTASMGVPVFKYAGTVEANSEIPHILVTLPALRENTGVEIVYDSELAGTTNATDQKRFKFYLESTQLNNFNNTASNKYYPIRHGFTNQADASVQRGLAGENANGYAQSTLVPLTAAIATGTAGKIAKIAIMIETVNVAVRINSYKVFIRG